MEIIILLGISFVAIVWWSASSKRSSQAQTGLPVTLLITIEDSHSIPPPIPEGRSVNVRRDRLDSEETSSESANKILAGMAFFIIYEDAKGDVTERRITIRKITDKGDDLYITAFCHERQALRSFYSSRIEELTDLATGEVVDDATSYLKSLTAANGFGKPTEAPTDEAEMPTYNTIFDFDPLGKAMAEFHSKVIALIFMARADGRMVKAERKIIFDFVKERLPEGTFADEKIDSYIARMYPDKELFKDAFSHVLSLDEKRRAKLIQALELVIAADGKVKEGETSMMNSYREALLSKAA